LAVFLIPPLRFEGLYPAEWCRGSDEPLEAGERP
jgi:hypothetical protein